MLVVLDLPDDLLRLEPGRIVYLSPLRSGPAAGTWAISVPLVPFSAADRFDPATFRPGSDGPEIIKTAIVGEFIDLPGNDLAALTNRTFDFPINPHPGYIDASIYLGGGTIRSTSPAWSSVRPVRSTSTLYCTPRSTSPRKASRSRTGQRSFTPTSSSSGSADCDAGGVVRR